MIFSCSDLTWKIRGQSIVEAVSFDVVEGETLGLIGPNGSGKSTLMKLMTGILSPSHGTLTFKGQPFTALSRREAARRLALVEQQAETDERLTARQAVELGRTPWLSALQPWSAEDDRKVARALSDVHMEPFAKRQWHTLSGGERQRLHIARALAQEPRLLFLDEPTNHLDIEHQLGILHLLRALDLTTVIAMHDLNQAMACDRVCVLQAGRLVACGPPEEVLTAPLLREVFRVEARFLEDRTDGQIMMRFFPMAI